MDKVMTVNNFTKKYGKFTAVDNITFDLNPGEIVGFVGENGAGKSTTIRCLTNMLFPSSGEIRVLGLDSVKEAKKINEKVAYLSGETEFYKGINAKKLFKIHSYHYPGSFEEALGLSQRLDLDVNKKVSSLSLGNRKKVSIVLTLMKPAELIVMDEPTSGLDPLVQSEFFHMVLDRVKKGTTVFLSSHNLNEVEKYCDRVIIIKEGKIVDTICMEALRGSAKQICKYTTTSGEEQEFKIKEDINDLIGRLSSMELEHLEIRNQSVEEDLMDYYEGGGNHE